MVTWADLQPTWAQVGTTWQFIQNPGPKPPPPPWQGGAIRIEVGFTLTANLQTIAGANPPFTLDDPVLGELDVAELPGGDVWIDVSEFLIDGMSINRGRNRAVDLFTAGTAAFRLNNRDRVFDPTNLLSPFFGNLTPMRPVRISAEVNGSVERLFQGFVTDWTFRYGQPVDAWVEVDCVDGFIAFAADELPTVTPVGDEDTSDQRVARVLDLVGFGPQRNLTVGTFELAETDFGVNALQHMQQAAASDASLLFMSRDGVVTLLNPTTVFGAATSITFVQSNVSDAGTRYHGVEFTTASELLFNTVQVQWDGGTVIRTDTDSVGKYLPRTLSIQTLLKNEVDAELLADFALVRFAEPELRFSEVSVKVHDRRLTSVERQRLCQLDVGSTVEVIRRPPGVGSPEQFAFKQAVEGLTWRYSRDSWTVTYRLGDVVGAPFTLDDAVLGALDTGGILTF
jgi:hypothetical protein